MSLLNSSFAALIAMVWAASAIAQTGVRLLPESVSKEIRMKWVQDGRAIDLTAAAPKTDWVIETLTVQYQYQTSKTSVQSPMHFTKEGELRGGKANAAKGEIDAVAMPSMQQISTVELKFELLPGKSAKSNFEVQTGERVVTLSVIEARGRELNITQRLRSLIP